MTTGRGLARQALASAALPRTWQARMLAFLAMLGLPGGQPLLCHLKNQAALSQASAL